MKMAESRVCASPCVRLGLQPSPHCSYFLALVFLCYGAAMMKIDRPSGEIARILGKSALATFAACIAGGITLVGPMILHPVMLLFVIFIGSFAVLIPGMLGLPALFVLTKNRYLSRNKLALIYVVTGIIYGLLSFLLIRLLSKDAPVYDLYFMVMGLFVWPGAVGGGTFYLLVRNELGLGSDIDAENLPL